MPTNLLIQILHYLFEKPQLLYNGDNFELDGIDKYVYSWSSAELDIFVVRQQKMTVIVSIVTVFSTQHIEL